MKKVLLALFFSVGITSMYGQMTNFAYNINNTPTESPRLASNGIQESVYTRSANVDFEDTKKTMVGIVFQNTNNESYVYFAAHIEVPSEQYMNSNYDGNQTITEIEDNTIYEIKNPDIRMGIDANANELYAIIIYQRRMRNTNQDWEIHLRKFDVDYNSNIINIGAPSFVDIGKNPSIDAFADFQKEFNQNTFRAFKHFAIGYSNQDGYQMKIKDIVFNTYDETSIFMGFSPGYNNNDYVCAIDIATSKILDPAGNIENKVFAVYSHETNSYSFTEWDVFFTPTFSSATPLPLYAPLAAPWMPIGPYTHNMFGANQANRCRIEAMSLQMKDKSVKFTALVEIDMSNNVIFFGRPGYVEEVFSYFATDASSSPDGINFTAEGAFLQHGFDVAAGVGDFTDFQFFNNLNYSIAKESSINNVYGELNLNRIGINMYTALPNSIPSSAYYLMDRVSNNPYISPQYLYGNSYFCTRYNYGLDNVSTSASINSGKFSVKTWIEGGDVYYKAFNAIQAIDFFAPNSQWRTPAAITAQSGNLELYPNPAQQTIYIKNNQQVIQSLQIIDMMGKTIHAANVNAHETAVNTSQYSSGSYWVSIQQADGKVLQKQFIIQH
jgi:hypothetical protein